MSDEQNPLYIDQDALIAGVASLGDWLDEHGPLAAWEEKKPMSDFIPPPDPTLSDFRE